MCEHGAVLIATFVRLRFALVWSMFDSEDMKMSVYTKNIQMYSTPRIRNEIYM